LGYADRMPFRQTAPTLILISNTVTIKGLTGIFNNANSKKYFPHTKYRARVVASDMTHSQGICSR
jgi:hypothetical protein